MSTATMPAPRDASSRLVSVLTSLAVEARLLFSTPAVYVAAAVVLAATALSVVSGVLMAGRSGLPPLGSAANVSKTLSVAAVSSMTMLVIGIVAMAGEHRHRTIVWAYLAQPRRERVLGAKLAVTGLLGGLVGAATFALALAIAVPLYAAHGVHQLGVDVAGMWWGATLSGACYGLLGVALGALTRNIVAAVIGALAWVQVVEVGILQNVWPAAAKWLPTGAAVAVTGPSDPGLHLLSPAVAAIVLVGWAGLICLVAVRISVGREPR